MCFYLSASDKPKEDVWKIHEALSKESGDAQDEYKRMRAVVGQLRDEYDNSKEVDYFRRYGMLKGMIKRSVLTLKLKDDTNQHQQLTTGMREKEEKRKRVEQISGTIFCYFLAKYQDTMCCIPIVLSIEAYSFHYTK